MSQKVDAIRQQIDTLSDEEWNELKGDLFILPPPRKPKPPKGLKEQLGDTIKLASRVVNRFDTHRQDPAFDKLDLKPYALPIILLAEAFTELVNKLEKG